MFNSLDEAIAARDELVDRVQSIDEQLSYKASQVKGQRVPQGDFQAYLEWKARACHAKRKLIKQLRETKAWVAKQREAEYTSSHHGDAGVLLRGLYSITKGLVLDGAEVSQEEQKLLLDVDTFLNGVKEVRFE